MAPFKAGASLWDLLREKRVPWEIKGQGNSNGWEWLVARNAPVNFDGLRSKRECERDYRFHDAVFAYARRVEIATIAARNWSKMSADAPN